MSIRKLSERWLDRVVSIEPLHAAIAAATWSLVLLVGSFAVGVFQYEYGGREVGYASSLNWAIGFTLIVPLFYFFLLTTLQEMSALGSRLASAGMLLDGELKPHPNGATLATNRWKAMLKRYSLSWMVFSILGLLESLWEWWTYSGGPLWTGDRSGVAEVDWSIKQVGAEAVTAKAAAAFSLVVFLQQALLIAMIALLLHFALAMNALVRDLRQPGRAARLFPSGTYSPDDPRCGFQQFSTVLSHFLLAGACLYSQLLLSRLWNAYLHTPEKSALNVWGFIREEFLEGADVALDLKSLRGSILEYLRDLGALDFSGLMVALGAVLLFLVSLGLMIVVLRRAARESRHELLNSGIRGVAKERLTKMVFWPLRFPRLTTLLAIGFMAILGMVAYKAAILFLGIAFGLALTAALTEILPRIAR
ncbi:MAG: hypothetical protein AAF481_12255 [Acidobacteriota bacterium]